MIKNWIYIDCIGFNHYLTDSECRDYLKKIDIDNCAKCCSGRSLIPYPIDKNNYNKEIYNIIKEKVEEYNILREKYYPYIKYLEYLED